MKTNYRFLFTNKTQVFNRIAVYLCHGCFLPINIGISIINIQYIFNIK